MCGIKCVLWCVCLEWMEWNYGMKYMEMNVWNGMECMYVWNLKELAISSPVHSFHAANLICMRRAMWLALFREYCNSHRLKLTSAKCGLQKLWPLLVKRPSCCRKEASGFTTMSKQYQYKSFICPNIGRVQMFTCNQFAGRR